MLRVNAILIGLWATLFVQASAASNDLSAAGVAEFTAAYQAWDGARFVAAAELFRRATTNAPTNVTNVYWLDPRWRYDSCLTFLGRTYERLGQRKEAVDCFRRALAMHPADHLAKEGLKRASENK